MIIILEEIEKNLELGKEKLVCLKESYKDFNPADKDKVNREHEKLRKEWIKRKRMCMDVVCRDWFLERILKGYVSKH